MSTASVRTAASALLLIVGFACSARTSNPNAPEPRAAVLVDPQAAKGPAPGVAVTSGSGASAAPDQTQKSTTEISHGATAAAAEAPAELQGEGTAFETMPSGVVVDLRTIGGPAPGPPLPKGTRILHVGDSFAGALGIELNKVFADAGVVGRLEFEKSTYIPTWAHNGRATRLISSFKPDLILISLGANELDNPEPEKRAPLIQKIAKSFEPIPCVWIAPLLWTGAKDALLDVIRSNLLTCTFLDSNAVVRKMPRAADRIHPAMAARPDWALATARWLAYHRAPTEESPWTLMRGPR